MSAQTPPLLTILGFGPQGWGAQFAAGTLITIEISLGSYAVGIGLGLLGAGCRLSRSTPLRGLGSFYTTVVRALPELLLIILLFYTGTQLFNELLAILGLAGRLEISGFATAIVTLGFVQGAYMAEVLRGAIQAVSRSYVEAAKSLALTSSQRFRLVVLPLMLRIALPGMSNLWQSALKESALVSVVGFSELMTVGKNAAGETKYYLGCLCFTAAIYLSLTLVSNIGFGLVERRLRRGFD